MDHVYRLTNPSLSFLGYKKAKCVQRRKGRRFLKSLKILWQQPTQKITKNSLIFGLLTKNVNEKKIKIMQLCNIISYLPNLSKIYVKHLVQNVYKKCPKV